MLFFCLATPSELVGTYQRFGGKYSLKSALNMEAVYSYETLVSTYKSRRRYNPEKQERHNPGNHRCFFLLQVKQS
jgi:hypothetical protein